MAVKLEKALDFFCGQIIASLCNLVWLISHWSGRLETAHPNDCSDVLITPQWRPRSSMCVLVGLRWWNRLKCASGGLHPFAFCVLLCISKEGRLCCLCGESGEGWQQGRQAHLQNWHVEVVLGVNETRPSADSGLPLRIPKLHLLQRMDLPLCTNVDVHVFFTRVRGFVLWRHPGRGLRLCYTAPMKRWKMY